MGWVVREAAKILKPEFDKYRDQIAAVEDIDGNDEGVLVTYAEAVDELVGFRGLRLRVRPTEIFKGWFMPTTGRADEVLDLSADELDRGRWDRSRLRWLTGPERDAAWAKYLDEWGPHEGSDLNAR